MLHFIGENSFVMLRQKCLIQNISWLLCIFWCIFCCSKCLYILLEVLFHLSRSFLCIQVKLELLSPEIVSALKNKEPVSHSAIYRKSAQNTQKDGGTVIHRCLLIGPNCKNHDLIEQGNLQLLACSVSGKSNLQKELQRNLSLLSQVLEDKAQIFITNPPG